MAVPDIKGFLLLQLLCFVVFIVTDNNTAFVNGGQLVRALSDNFCHALISGLSWGCTISLGVNNVNMLQKKVPHNGKWCKLARWRSTTKILAMELLLSCLVGSLVDIDHFICAQSFSLHDATSLSYRPVGHALTTCFVLTSLCALVTRSARCTLILFSAYFSHLLRDSVRRGLWLSPWPATSAAPVGLSTPPLPLWLVFGLYAILPIVYTSIQRITILRERHDRLEYMQKFSVVDVV